MEALHIRTTLRLEDWTALSKAVQARLAPNSESRTALTLVAWSLCSAGVLYFVNRAGLEIRALDFALGAVFVAAVILVSMRHQRRLWRPDADGFHLGDFELEFGAEGIRSRHARGEAMIRWSALRGISATPTHVFLWVDRLSAVIVPSRQLPEGLATASFIESIRDRARAAGVDPRTLEPDTAIAGAESRVDASASTTHTSDKPLGALTLFLPHRPGAPASAPSEAGVAALVVISVGLWAGIDRASRNDAVQFTPWFGLAGIAWYVLTGLGIAWVVARLSSPRQRFSVGAWTVASIAPAVILLEQGMNWIAASPRPLGWFAAIAGPILVVLLAARALRIATGAAQWRAVGAGLLASLAVGLAQQNAYVNASMWLPLDPEGESSTYSEYLDSEEVLYSQSARVDAALAAVAQRDAGRANAFFVGFAGVGEQRVFAEEIRFASQVFGQRYGSDTRTVLLANDQRDTNAAPLASVTNLRQTLRGIAARMDIERDVLFLVLSSHGSDDPELSVSNGMLPLRRLSGSDLATALRQSGIRWKVVVVSACHAGAFIPILRDDDTIVLAAAAADRSSFGCDNERDLTYFGEALFRDALPTSTDLAAAFESARVALERRERAEAQKLSMPQAHFGAAMMARLREIDRGPITPAPAASPSNSTNAR